MRLLFILLFIHIVSLQCMDSNSNLHLNLFSIASKKIITDDTYSHIIMLLENGADPTITDEKEKTPIHYFLETYEKTLEECKILLSCNFELHPDQNILQEYASKILTTQNCIALLIEKGLEVDDMFVAYQSNDGDSIVSLKESINSNFSDIITQIHKYNY